VFLHHGKAKLHFAATVHGNGQPGMTFQENFCHLIGKKTQPFIGQSMSTRLASSPPWPQFIVSQFLKEIAATLLLRGLLLTAGQG
jgi:hypothetical protein